MPLKWNLDSWLLFIKSSFSHLMPFTTPLYVGMQQKEDMLLQGRMWTAHDGWLKYPGIMESHNLHTIGINMYTVNGMGSFLDGGTPIWSKWMFTTGKPIRFRHVSTSNSNGWSSSWAFFNSHFGAIPNNSNIFRHILFTFRPFRPLLCYTVLPYRGKTLDLQLWTADNSCMLEPSNSLDSVEHTFTIFHPFSANPGCFIAIPMPILAQKLANLTFDDSQL